MNRKAKKRGSVKRTKRAAQTPRMTARKKAGGASKVIQPSPLERRVFLSHRFADKKIADVVRRHLKRWGLDDVIQESSPEDSTLKVGKDITEGLKRAVCESNLVILIYTLPDQDWSFCMWECGLAAHPTNTNTNTIVFRCSDTKEGPRTFAGDLLVQVNEQEIRKFTTQFHRAADFFPGQPAYRPRISDSTLLEFSTDFFNDLKDVIVQDIEERYRWDFLTVELAQADVDELRKGGEQVTVENFAKMCKVIESFGEALKHFGYVEIEKNLKLSGLLSRWKKETKGRKNVETEWITELGREVYRAIANSPANPEWKKMNSVNFPGSWFHPVVNHVRVMHGGSMEFEIYLYRSLQS